VLTECKDYFPYQKKVTHRTKTLKNCEQTGWWLLKTEQTEQFFLILNMLNESVLNEHYEQLILPYYKIHL